jgi:hypothetical protein
MDATLGMPLLQAGDREQLYRGKLGLQPYRQVISMVVYSALVVLNILAVTKLGLRPIAALASGLLHLTLGTLHIARLIHPFRSEVLGHPWPLASSLREVLIVVPFGLACLAVAYVTRRTRA